MNNFEGTFELKSPLTKECWDKLADVEFENTERIWFTTPSEKRVEYIKASVLDKIRAEIDGIEINGQVDEHTAFTRTGEQVKQMALDIINKYKAEIEPQETETWNGYHGQITAPKGTFEKIYEDAESEG